MGGEGFEEEGRRIAIKKKKKRGPVRVERFRRYNDLMAEYAGKNGIKKIKSQDAL
jgi:hypothetical protein